MAAVDPVRALLTPEAVRERCETVFEFAVRGETRYFALDLDRLDVAADLVVDEIRRNYPAGNVPFHSRWRHFELGGRNLWREMLKAHGPASPDDVARTRIDLAMVSVLLDAGVGPDWKYHDAATGLVLGRSEGLALASLRFFESGGLSANPERDLLRVDQAPLGRLTVDALAAAFQVSTKNPLLGLDARVRLLNNLGRAIGESPVFARNGVARPGHLFDDLRARAENGTIPARLILTTLLEQLGSIWPTARRIGRVTIADAGDYSLLRRDDDTDRIVPFHKLSQWLSYSLIEPFVDAGFTVADPDALTGLAEYRNGGLLIDTGVLRLKDPAERDATHAPTDELIVEWRALTVALLDRLAATVRAKMGVEPNALPLAAVLQGGTWSAGRRLAADLRPSGSPPLKIATDGTLF
jgi:hypothetical protein